MASCLARGQGEGVLSKSPTACTLKEGSGKMGRQEGGGEGCMNDDHPHDKVFSDAPTLFAGQGSGLRDVIVL